MSQRNPLLRPLPVAKRWRTRSIVCIGCQQVRHQQTQRWKPQYQKPAWQPVDQEDIIRRQREAVSSKAEAQNLNNVVDRALSTNPEEVYEQRLEDVFEALRKDGAMTVDHRRALKFVRDFKVLPGGINTFRKLCSVSGLSIDDAYTIARTLLRIQDQGLQQLGKACLTAACKAGSAMANIHVIRTAMRLNTEARDGVKSTQLRQNPEVQWALDQLDMMLARISPPVPALVVKAQLLEMDGDYRSAADAYQKAIDNAPDIIEGTLPRIMRKVKDRFTFRDEDKLWDAKIINIKEDRELDIAAAHLGLAGLQSSRLDDPDAAKRHLEIAALEYDDPLAYHELAKLIEAETRRKHPSEANNEDPLNLAWIQHVPYEWYQYELKAAASGHAEACYGMGIFYLGLTYSNRWLKWDKGRYKLKFDDPRLAAVHYLRHPLTVEYTQIAWREPSLVISTLQDEKPEKPKEKEKEIKAIRTREGDINKAFDIARMWLYTALGLGYLPARIAELASSVRDVSKPESAIIILNRLAYYVLERDDAFPDVQKQAAMIFYWMRRRLDLYWHWKFIHDWPHGGRASEWHAAHSAEENENMQLRVERIRGTLVKLETMPEARDFGRKAPEAAAPEPPKSSEPAPARFPKRTPVISKAGSLPPKVSKSKTAAKTSAQVKRNGKK